MTAPFGAVLEAALKERIQNASLSMSSGLVRNPDWFCCTSGLALDQDGNPSIDKDPVAILKPESGRRVCTCATVTVDYSGSWSPSSTINTWSVNWGDGNISNGAWPGAGSVNHPGGCGGYALPGHYTITLTVTDLLGATHSDQIAIEVIDCTTWGTIEMFCSTFGTGNPIWFTNDAGGNWADRSGQVLAGANAYDLKINPFTIPIYPFSTTDNSENVELWTCTDLGLYVAYDGARQGNSWRRNTLPSPGGGLPEPGVRAVLPSYVDRFEIYVLTNNVANNRVWLYRSTDGGFTWNSLELLPAVGAYQNVTFGWTHTLDMSFDGQYIYVGLLDSSLDPVIVRVNYDLSAQVEIFDPGTGSWGGVRADYNYSNVLWVFGDFNTLISVSDDWGDTFADVSPWPPAHTNPLILPVLPSLYDPAYVIAINNTDLESAITTDFGENWVISALPTPFDCQCGERGWYDDYLIFLGGRLVGADHLQLSINLGVSMWTERSGGLPAGVPVTSIQILWEHGTL